MAETSKKRTARIPLDYYKHPERIAYWKLVLSTAAVLIAGGWALGLSWDFWSTARREERSRRLASHGPLARVHATWESQCEACHAPFRPIGLATWADPILGDSSRSNAQCQRCHAGPIHHASQDPQDLACAGCHHDHRGRDASLVRMPDQHCTQCHADLSAHMKEDQGPIIAKKVTRFDANPNHHPEFRATRDEDPGSLQFDHARHLNAGMASSSTGPIQTLMLLRESDRERYRSYVQGAKGVIQLRCEACHRLDREDLAAPGKSGTARSAGAYMLPVTYENDCKACHPLDYDPAAPSLVMAHPLRPAEVHESLWQTYAAEYLSQNAALLDRPITPRPLPGRAEPPEIRQARQVIDRKAGNAEKILFGAKKCGECHLYETVDHRAVASLDHWDPAHPVQIKPTNVPEVWFDNAVFDHSAHRGVSCRECHERAYPDHRNASHQGRDVLLPTIKTCLQCHSQRQRGTAAGSELGGAGFDCTECHRYHHGDAPLQGLGAAARDARVESTIEQFLLGAPSSSRP